MRVKIYSTPTCTYCEMVKKYLKSKNISYENIDVSADKSAAAEMVARSGRRGVPVIDIDGELVLGFDKDKIDSLLF